jgi:hypothetical protein
MSSGFFSSYTFSNKRPDVRFVLAPESPNLNPESPSFNVKMKYVLVSGGEFGPVA